MEHISTTVINNTLNHLQQSISKFNQFTTTDMVNVKRIKNLKEDRRKTSGGRYNFKNITGMIVNKTNYFMTIKTLTGVKWSVSLYDIVEGYVVIKEVE